MNWTRRSVLGGIAGGTTVLSLGGAVPASATAPTEWPQFKFDAGNTGYAPDRTVPTEVETKWQYSVDRPVESAPAVADGRCFVGANDGQLHAFDAATGDAMWRSEVGGDVRSAPAVAGETVCVGGRTQNYGFDATNGEQRWSRRTTASAVQTAPNVSGRSVYLSKGDETTAIEAIFHASGEHRVTFDTPLGPTTPAVANGSMIAGFEDGFLKAYDTRITNEAWSVTSDTPVTVTPVVTTLSDHRQPSVVFGDRSGALRVHNASNGRNRWTYNLNAISGSPAVGGNRIVVGTGGFTLQAFNTSGTPVWSRELDGRVVASPVMTEHTVLVGAGSTMYALASDSGATRWSVTLDGTVTRGAAIAGGYVFVGTDGGHCYALGAPDRDFGDAPETATATPTPSPTSTETPSATPTDTDSPTPTESETPTPTRTTAPGEPTPSTPEGSTDSILGGVLDTLGRLLDGFVG